MNNYPSKTKMKMKRRRRRKKRILDHYPYLIEKRRITRKRLV
jgi:hypothetical protein